jgi:hypothetical protein
MRLAPSGAERPDATALLAWVRMPFGALGNLSDVILLRSRPTSDGGNAVAGPILDGSQFPDAREEPASHWRCMDRQRARTKNRESMGAVRRCGRDSGPGHRWTRIGQGGHLEANIRGPGIPGQIRIEAPTRKAYRSPGSMWRAVWMTPGPTRSTSWD